MSLLSLVPPLLGVVLSPLLFGIIQRTKAWFAGRKGPPFHQPYLDLWRLVRKGAVYSTTTSWVFRAGPVVSLGTLLVATLLMPMGRVEGLLAFPGDVMIFAYLLALMRWGMVLAALDTGSSFEGMGASREVWVSALAEPALFLCLGGLARLTHSLSLSQMFGSLGMEHWTDAGPALALLSVGMGIVVLAENARIPIDDPATHLELTMIHEVMILDHSGPDLALLEYAAALKFWLTGLLLVNTVMVASGSQSIAGSLGLALAGLAGLAVLVGVVESVMARLRLLSVPQLLVGAAALGGLALMLTRG
jgi:formate hydrogenlyase subunit 4